MEQDSTSDRGTVNIVRWIARVLGTLVILLFVYLFVGEGIGGSSTQVSTKDTVQLLLTAVELVGLGLAWKWELAGGATTLVAFAVRGMVNPLAFKLFFLAPVPAILFLLCWWFSRTAESGERGMVNVE